MFKTQHSISPFRLFRRAIRLRRFSKDENGVTMIEFGLLALPFFALLGAILETSVVFLATQFLDTAVHDSARLIRTGQAENASYTATEFRAAICEGLYGMFDCDQLKIRVSEVANFTAANVVSVVDVDDGAWTLVDSYNDGGGDSIILVEAYYKWHTSMDMLNFTLSTLPDDTRLLSAVRIFRNEPF